MKVKFKPRQTISRPLTLNHHAILYKEMKLWKVLEIQQQNYRKKVSKMNNKHPQCSCLYDNTWLPQLLRDAMNAEFGMR